MLPNFITKDERLEDRLTLSEHRRPSSWNPPLQNPARELVAQLHLDPQCIRFDFRESRLVELIDVEAIVTRSSDLMPLAVLAIKQFPGFWRTAAAARGGIVKPVDLDLRNFSRRIKLALHPFLRSLMVPPSETRNGVVVGIIGNAPVS